VRMAARALFLAWTSAATSGCHLNNVCGITQQDLGLDGGTSLTCARSEDCPRPANVFVCATNGDPDKKCVRCSEENRCLLIVPQFCRQ
jgi:hypothetical protein